MAVGAGAPGPGEMWVPRSPAPRQDKITYSSLFCELDKFSICLNASHFLVHEQNSYTFAFRHQVTGAIEANPRLFNCGPLALQVRL